jgi:hypothetical protein
MSMSKLDENFPILKLFAPSYPDDAPFVVELDHDLEKDALLPSLKSLMQNTAAYAKPVFVDGFPLGTYQTPCNTAWLPVCGCPRPRCVGSSAKRLLIFFHNRSGT